MSFRSIAWRACLVLTLAGAAAAPAAAQIKIGMTLSSTGPAASIGAPSKNVALMWPKEIAGQKIEYFILDDGSNPTGAVVHAS